MTLMAENARGTPTPPCGHTGSKTFASPSATPTWSHHSIPDVEESPAASTTPSAKPLLKRVAPKIQSVDDLASGKLARFLHAAETVHGSTLERLKLIVPHNRCDPSPVYEHALHADRFPALRSLSVGGFFPTTMRTFRNLRCLLLSSPYRSLHSTVMSLQEFVAVLGTWTELEELALRRYSPALAWDEGCARPPPATLPKLRKLTIADAPDFFPMLLPCLRLSSTADVHIITLHHHPVYPDSCKDTFSALVFEHRSESLPILGEIDEAAITTFNRDGEDYGLRLAGTRASGAPGSFTYDVQSTAPISLKNEIKYRRWFLDWAIQHLAKIFPSGPSMRTLRCTGDFQDVPESTWVEVLQSYPSLAELAVEDVGGTQAVIDLFSALSWPIQGTDIISRNLEGLSVRGAFYTPGFVQKIGNCFRQRHRYLKSATRTTLDLEMTVCDAPYSSEAQDRDVRSLEKLGVDASIQASDCKDVLAAMVLELGSST